MNPFSIHNVKTVVEVYEESEVNRLLRGGWVLLSVGFHAVDGEMHKTYILGNTDTKDPYSSNLNSRLAKLRN